MGSTEAEMSDSSKPRIDCSVDTRQIVRAQKRGGQSYDELLQQMAEQYDPVALEPGDGVIRGDEKTKLPCSTETRELLKELKRGGECYDELLRKMVEQYDPTASDARSPSDARRGNA